MPGSRDVAAADPATTSAPHGPLVGDELARAVELLTDQQLRAYRARREGHAWNWIAQRMRVSRQRVIHLVAKAEKHLGYESTVTPKQKAAYKPAAQKRAERARDQEREMDGYYAERVAWILPMPESAQTCACPHPWPNTDYDGNTGTCAHCGRRISQESEAASVRGETRRFVTRVESEADEQAERRLLGRLAEVEALRRKDDDHVDDLSSAVGDDAAEFHYALEELGVEHADELVFEPGN